MIDLGGQTGVISGGTPAMIMGIRESLQRAGAQVSSVDFHAHQMTDPAAIRRRLADFNRIDTIVILPSVYSTGEFLETSPADWDRALSANYEHAVYVAQAAAQHMIARAVRGSIIFISTVAIQMPLLQTSVYGTSMAALFPLAKMAAVDCAAHGIRVNTVMTGWIEDEWTAVHLSEATNRQAVQAGIPLGEIGSPAAVGDVCCFLASPLSRYITGGLIPVDGGYTLTRSEGTGPYPGQ